MLMREENSFAKGIRNGLPICFGYLSVAFAFGIFSIANGLTVPEVLRSGDHAKVARWQKKQAILRTLHRRPDLFYKLRFPYKTRAERKFIAELEAEDDAFRDRDPKNLDYRK